MTAAVRGTSKTDQARLNGADNIYGGKTRQQGANRLFHFILLVSLGVHAAILLHITGLYRSSAIHYIELSMEDLSNRFSRTIPRPITRPRQIDQPDTAQKIRVNPHRVPRIQPVAMEPAHAGVTSDLMAPIDAPGLAAGMVPGRDAYQIGEILDTSAKFTTRKSYYEMVMIKIETSKKYPEQAKTMNKEGRITVGFTLTLQGTIRNLRIVKPCVHTILNQAALQAVKDAAPFPRPPYRFFKGDIPMELNVIFETT